MDAMSILKPLLIVGGVLHAEEKLKCHLPMP